MKLFIKSMLVSTFIAGSCYFMTNANAASDTASALQVVISALSIANQSNLDFGSAPQGDAAKTVLPGSSDDSENASFNVSGQGNATYTITLPASVTMTTGDGIGADKQILVNSFASNPSGTGTLNGSGTQLLLVGATRAALSATQVTGSYTATFTVTVVY